MVERRGTPRYKVQQRAWIADPNGLALVVSDLSVTGARLSGVGVKSIPERFNLLMLGLSIPARVVWRSEDIAGIVFDGEPAHYDGFPGG